MMMSDTLVRDFEGGVTLVCEPWMEGRPRQRPEPAEKPLSAPERRLMLMERLVEAVNAAPKPISAADAAAQVGMGDGYARTLLQELAAAGRVSRTRRVNLTFYQKAKPKKRKA